jgi:hypothetical protein
VIFDIVEYIIMEWTMPNESRTCRISCGRRVLIQKKKSVAGWPVCRSQVWVRNVLLDSKTKLGRLRGRQVLGNFVFLAG